MMSIKNDGTNKPERDGLTGLRGVAALLVFVFHWFGFAEPRLITIDIAGQRFEIQWLITGGFTGVHIFFVLSGFLLALPFARHALGDGPAVNPLTYLSRRLRRVFPAYWAQLIILVGVGYLMTQQIPPIKKLLAHIAMLPITWKAEYIAAISGIYWSLPTELLFYFVLPVLAFLIGRIPGEGIRKWLIAGGVLIVAAIIYRFYAFQMVRNSTTFEKFWILGQLPGYIDLFAYGLLGAFAVAHLEGKPTQFYTRRSNLLFMLGITGFMVCMYSVHRNFMEFWNGHWLLFFFETFTGFFIILLVLGVMGQGKMANLLLANPAMRYLGLISYSIYLWSFPVQRWLALWLSSHWPGDKLWPMLISAPLTLVVASVSWYLTEAPFLKAKRLNS